MSSVTPPPAAFPDASNLASGQVHFGFQNTYARLPERFYARLNPTPVAGPKLVKLNSALAINLGLDPETLASAQGVEILSGNRVAQGSEPLAIAYAGHQFGHFVPQLGDGRANLLGEVLGRGGLRYDIQLKGSGPTPFSRRGDGRAALGPVLREYILSEAMAALGVPTTRALAAVTTGENVFREDIFPGAVFTRVAASHLRVGTFQYFAALGDTEGIRTLADYAVARHYPDLASTEHPYRALLQAVVSRHSDLVAQWMLLGFIHGVMNTDNTSISGETIDYGPCAFMEAYDPAAVFSSIDRNGRYAYGNQPNAALWNLARLAEALLPVMEIEAGSREAALDWAYQALATFEPRFELVRNAGLRRKLGLFNEREGDDTLAQDLLNRMAANAADFTLTFRRLSEAAVDQQGDDQIRILFADPAAYDAWAVRWRERLKMEVISGSESDRQALAAAIRTVSPKFIPRNHLVEAAIVSAVERQDFQPFEQLLDATSRPYEERPGLESFTLPARLDERVTQTFCGT